MSRPLLVLLPEPLEAFAHRSLVEELLGSGLAAAADPPRVSYRRQAALPPGMVLRQARRLRRKLREEPRAVMIFDQAQYPLAHALLRLVPGCELWFEDTLPPADPRAVELHALATERAHLTFSAADRAALEAALERL